jgi:predicted  nucleic acid-binding Zn-ribbon protein
MSDSTQSPVQQLAEEINSLQSSINSLQEDVRLAKLRDEMATIDNSTNRLTQQILDLRSRGYVFENDLEAKAADLNQRWVNQRPQVEQQINQQANALDMDMRQLASTSSQLAMRSSNPYAAQPYLAQAKSELAALQSKVSAAENTIQGMYRAFTEDADKINAHLKEIDWMLTQLSQASFQLLPTEAGLMAVNATWIKGGKESKDDPQGVLYLTDQRLIFEQKQEIATKKVLFIATEKQKVQKLQLEVPIVLTQEVKPTKQGMFGHEDHLELSFASGAPVNNAHFHINGQDCNAWQGLLNRAKVKDFDKGRSTPVDKTEVEKVKAAPTQCPICGGAITKPVLRGMDTITCEYCGNVIKL